MCGILGFSGEPAEGQWGETHRLLQALFLASEHRGRHATGFVAKSQPFKRRDSGGGDNSGGVVMAKRPLAARRFVRRSGRWRALRHRRSTTVIGHVRWATHGPPEVNTNNHPHRGRRGLYLVHNGVLTDHEGVCERKGLTLKSECDSETILRVVESERTPVEGLDVALQDIRGSMALAVYDSHEDVTYLARNEGRPLWLAKLRGDRRWFYASTRDILLEAFTEVLGRHADEQIEMLFPLATYQVHVLRSDGSLIAMPPLSDRQSW